MLPKNYIRCNCFLFVEGDRRLSFVEREADQLPEFSLVRQLALMKEEKNTFMPQPVQHGWMDHISGACSDYMREQATVMHNH